MNNTNFSGYDQNGDLRSNISLSVSNGANGGNSFLTKGNITITAGGGGGGGSGRFLNQSPAYNSGGVAGLNTVANFSSSDGTTIHTLSGLAGGASNNDG
jgi:hypothetical protein